MPQFSKLSRAKLSTCHPDLQLLFNEIIKFFDCRIMEGHRDEQAQEQAFRDGKSDKRWPDGRHNSFPSMAVDVYPLPIDFTNTEAFYYFAGFVKGYAQKMGIKIRYGGDWDSDNDLKDQKLFDLVHFEIVE